MDNEKKMTIEDGIREEERLAQLAASDVRFREELLRRNGPDPYIQYWLEESETKRKYHEQVAEWLKELLRIRTLGRQIDPEAMILGYRIRDLAITADRIRKEGMEPWKLRNSTEDFMAGYEMARNEMDKAMAESIQAMMMPMPAEKEPEEKANDEDF